MSDPGHVFISHASVDAEVARRICAVLEAGGCPCWIAPRDITPGVPYSASILGGINDSRVLVLVYSGAANESPQVLREVERAVSKRVVLLPFRIADVPLSPSMEYFISTPHWLNAFPEPQEQHFHALLAAVHAQMGLATPSPSPTAVPAAGPSGPLFQTWRENPDLLLHQRVGPYLLLQTIGSGGSGVVYRARHSRLGSIVAVKVFFPIAPNRTHLRAALQQALTRCLRGLSSLGNPNLIRVHDFGEFDLPDGHSFYLAMDYVQGATLDVWSRDVAARADAEEFRLRLALSAARALQAAHECRFQDELGFEQVGVPHGDLKPGNIMVRPDGSPVLLDFLVIDLHRLFDPRFVGETGDLRAGDQATGAFGTPGYMSPEQEQDGVVTTRSDIYSFGVTLAHLFWPLEWQRIVAGRVGDTDSRAALLRLVRAMLCADPAGRPSGMGVVVAALEQIERGEAGAADGNPGALGPDLPSLRPGDSPARAGEVSLYPRPKRWHCLFCGWCCDDVGNDYLCRRCEALRPFAGGSATMVNCRACGEFSLGVAAYCEWCGSAVHAG